MAEHSDLLVIGGGVIGLTTAYFVAREGVRVTVVDQGEMGQESSWAGAGILPPGNPDQARTPLDQLRAQSARMFPQLSAELRERTGIDNGYVRSGGLEFVAGAPEAAEQEWRGEGIVCERLDEPASRALEPALAAGLGAAFFLPDMAQVRNPRHVKALVAACQAAGVRFLPGCPVHRLERAGRQLQGVQTASGRLHAGRYLLAAGAWSGLLINDLGLQCGIQPVRGQIVLLSTGDSLFHRILMRGPCYLVPRPDGRVLLGSTEETVGFRKQTTAEAVQGLLAFGISLVPALAAARLERAWSGLRPGSPDGLPFLGAVPGLDNLFIAAGHFRAGIQLSPATALVLKELLLGQPTTVALTPFRLGRD
jgi:glycine oxidase